MGVYEDNLKILEARYTDIYNKILEDKNEFEAGYFVEIAKNNEPVLAREVQRKKIYFNSIYNPSLEAERYMKEYISLPEKSLLVMFGLSTGCFVTEFLDKNHKNNYILIYEPDINILKAIINEVDISEILNSNRILLFVDGVCDDKFRIIMGNMIADHNLITNKHIVLPKYASIYPEKLNKMVVCLNELYDKHKIFNNTVVKVGKLCFENSIKNLRHLSGSISSDGLIGAFPDDMPAIVVSAGPSLNKNVKLLKQAKGKSFIVCTDSAISTVLSSGVEPDMVVSVDFAKPLKLFEAPELKHIPFLADFDLNCKVLDFVNPDTVVFTTVTNAWSKLYKRENVDLTALDSGGSVATEAISSLVKWGFKKIILIGQDLAFTGNKIHAKEQVEDKIEINSDDYEFVEGLDGEVLPVRKDYFQYLRWIEQFGYVNKNIEIIDATEGGAKKKNTTIMTFYQAIEKYCLEEYNIKEIFENVPRLFEADKKKYIIEELEEIKKDIINFAERFSLASQLCDMGQSIMSSGKYEVEKLKLINAYIGQLDTDFLDARISPFVNQYVALANVELSGDIFIEDEDEISEAIRMYKKSKEYYGKIASELPNMVGIIEESIKEIQEGK